MDFVDFNLAKKLKEKGYPQRTFGKYDMQGACYIEDGRFYENGCITEVARAYTSPTISQVLKWLREEKSIFVEPCVLADADTDADGKEINEYTYWSFTVTDIETGDMIYFEYERIDDKRFDSYEQAAIAGIEYCLDNFI